MGATYEKANDDVMKLVRAVMSKNHPDLKAADVQAMVLMAHAPLDKSGRPKGPAILHHGYTAAATIKVLSLKSRVAIGTDVLMLIDGDEWPGWTDKRRRSLIDHELCHLAVIWEVEPVRGKVKGLAKTDDIGRPRLATRLHDWQLGGFRAVAERHGPHSFDVRNAIDFRDKFGQCVFAWDSELDGAEDAA